MYAFVVLMLIAVVADAFDESSTTTVLEAVSGTVFYFLLFTVLIHLGRKKRDSLALV